MDYNLYIILREKDLEKAGIFEVKTSWGGKCISYNPRRFVFEDKIHMFLSEYSKIAGVEVSINSNQVMLKIADGLRELEWEVNKQTESLKTNSIMKILQKICRLDKFYIYFLEDDEIIEQQINYTNVGNIFSLVIEALNWESPQNIKIFCE